MRVYVVMGQYHTFNKEHDWWTDYEELLEVFVNEQDAKKFVAGHDRKRYEAADPDDPTDVDNGNFYDDFEIEPRKLRTAWNA